MKIDKAFTLIEVIIVIAIVAVLAAASFLALNPAKRINDSQDSRRKVDLLSLQKAVQLYVAENNGSLPTEFSLSGLSEAEMEKIVIEGFDQEDVSFDLGTKRNVDRAQIILHDGSSIAVTLSLDKFGFKDPTQSPSLREAKALAGIDVAKAWSVQRFYGSRSVVRSGKTRGFVVKEFLEGSMLGEYTQSLPPRSQPESEGHRLIARATGQSFANALEHLGGVPRDANPLNLIVHHGDDGSYQVRNCDVEGIFRDADSIRNEIIALGNILGDYRQDFYAELPKQFRPQTEIPE